MSLSSNTGTPQTHRYERFLLAILLVGIGLMYLPFITREYGFLDDYVFLNLKEDGLHGEQGPFNNYLTWMGRPLMGATLFWSCEIADTVSGLAVIRIAGLVALLGLFYLVSRAALKAGLTGYTRLAFVAALCLTPTAAVCVGWVSAGLPHLGGLYMALFSGFCAWRCLAQVEPIPGNSIRALWGAGAIVFGILSCMFYQPTISLAYTVLFILYTARWKEGWSAWWRFIAGYCLVGISMVSYMLLSRFVMYALLHRTEEVETGEYKIVMASLSYMFERVQDFFGIVWPELMTFWGVFKAPDGSPWLGYLSAGIVLVAVGLYLYKNHSRKNLLTSALLVTALLATLWGCIFFYVMPRDGFMGLVVFRIWHGLMILSLFVVFACFQYIWKFVQERKPSTATALFAIPTIYCALLIAGLLTYYKPLFIDLCAEEWSTIRDGVHDQKDEIIKTRTVVIEPVLVTGFKHEGAVNRAELGHYYMNGNVATILNNALREEGIGDLDSPDMDNFYVHYLENQAPWAPRIPLWDIQLGEPIESGEDAFWGKYTRYPHGLIDSEYWGHMRKMENDSYEHVLFGVILPDKVEDGKCYFWKPNFGFCSFEIGNPKIVINYDEANYYDVHIPKILFNLDDHTTSHFRW